MPEFPDTLTQRLLELVTRTTSAGEESTRWDDSDQTACDDSNQSADDVKDTGNKAE